MNPIVINGTVLCDPITGIPRFVYEVVTRLDPCWRAPAWMCGCATGTMAARCTCPN